MKKIEYIKNQKMSENLIFIEECSPILDPNGRKRRAAIFQCVCTKKFKSRIDDIKSNKTISCGCKKGLGPKIYTKGDLINNVKFISSLGTRNRAQVAIFECPICKKDWKSLIGNVQGGNSKSCCIKSIGWSNSVWCSRFEEIYLYKVILYNKNETFIKIGITGNSIIEKRFKTMPYKFIVLKVIKGKTQYILNLEKRIKSYYKKFSYKPLKSFGGETECYKIK